MPSRRKERRSCVKIRLLFWNTSCCLSISYFYAGILDLTAWVKVSGSSHAKRITSGFMEKKEILIPFLSHWYFLFVMVKAEATILWGAPFIQGKWKGTVTGRERDLNMQFLQWQKLQPKWASPALPWRGGRTVPAQSFLQNHSPDCEQGEEPLESRQFLQKGTSHSAGAYIWVDSNPPDLWIPVAAVVSVSGSGEVPGFPSNLW